MKETLGIGIVGCGRIADMHVPGYRRRADARVVAICDTDEALLERRRVEWDVPRAYTRYDELLADPAVDAVEILTPHDTHAALVVAAARAKKHVSVQKPMAVTAKQCDEMARACHYAGVTLRVFENFIFYPPFVRLKQLVEAGEIGEVLTARARLGAASGGWRVPLSAWLWRLDPVRGGPGATIYDDGYHKFSMLVDLFGPIAGVKANVDRSLAVIDAPAVINITFRDSPALATFDAAFLPNLRVRSKYYGADERLELVGTRGTIRLTRCTARLFDEPAVVLERDGRTYGFDDVSDDWLESFIGSTHDFIDALRAFRAPRLEPSVGKHLVQAALAAYVSNATRQVVDPATVTGEEAI
ncbi:Gfo/Idh/MocA family oxidoreductase [bacterium]|nr:Gfo/Idh/MocA family oxidoreductase [bacterium]